MASDADRITALERQVQELLERIAALERRDMVIEDDLFAEPAPPPPPPAPPQLHIFFWFRHLAHGEDVKDAMLGPQTTIMEVKELVSGMLTPPVPALRITLLDDSREDLQNNKNLNDYDISDGDVIRVLIQPP
jgi:hypothetical protein